MLFNSIQFLFFFPLVTIIYFLIPHKYRWFHLLTASCVFYCAFIPVYIFILIFTIIIDYIAGILIENASGKKRKWFLVMSLIANIGVLAVFKYYNFFIDNMNDLLHALQITTHELPYLNIILPIGLSFHTFQAMSYTIEVYRGNQKSERHFGIYSLYVMFYPQLVAGPIERPQNLLHQFREKHSFDYDRVTSGMKMMLWGLFKKIVIADRLSIYVDAVYNNPENHSSATLLIATIFFAFQIYCDFSAYSEIAIGSARVMGFTLMTNFNKPYFSQSIHEFWQRWHISLSTWFRDYLYISLGGNRVAKWRWYFNLFFVFLVSGLWHGANWTFVIWGALHGFYLVFATVTKQAKTNLANTLHLEKIPRITFFYNVIITFTLATFAWIFFRATSVENAFDIIKGIFAFNHGSIFLGQPPTSFVYAAIGIMILLAVEINQEFLPNGISLFNNKNKWVRQLSYATTIILILLIGVLNGGQFIYFQF